MCYLSLPGLTGLPLQRRQGHETPGTHLCSENEKGPLCGPSRLSTDALLLESAPATGRGESDQTQAQKGQ